MSDRTLDEIIDDVRRIADELDRTPTVHEFHSRIGYGQQETDRFGGWNAVVEAAGLKSNRPGNYIETAKMVADLRQVTKELGRPPTKAEFDNLINYNPNTISGRFGSWNDALRAIGEKPNTGRTPDDYAEDIRELAASLGRKTRITELDERYDYSMQAIYKHFDSWSEALEVAGV